MKHLQFLSLRALALLSDGPLTLDELADGLFVCRRHVQRVLKNLTDNKFMIKSQMRGHVKQFWLSSTSNILPAALTSREQAALSNAMTTNDLHLQSAIYKLSQLVYLQFYCQQPK